MKKEWMSPKTIIGPVATGDYYYPRTLIVNEIWNEFDKGASILLAAPRRVGKSSIMRDLEANPKKNYIMKFEIVQGVNNKEDFYKTIFRLLYSCLGKFRKKIAEISNLIEGINISEIDIKGSIKIDGKPINYLDKIYKVLEELNKSEEKIILLLDELPEVLHNIHKQGKKDDASEILAHLRVWRQSNYKNIQFLLAGSIGIHYVVNAIEGRTKDLNDLTEIPCEPLQLDEAKAYIRWATDEATLQYSSKQINLILEKIQHYYTPYFINLMLDKLDGLARKDNLTKINTTHIDLAFQLIIKDNSNFVDWKQRLVDYLPKQKFDFVNEVLIKMAHQTYLNIQDIYDLAVKHQMTDEYMTLIRELEKDGYIVEETQDSKKYIYISPFLQTFWLNNNPIYHG